MKLLDYVNNGERGGQTRLAKALGVPVVTISHWANSVRPIPIFWCATIEIATEGAVTRKDLRPDDWGRIWPELSDKAVA